jgi:hypothetical protein
MRRRALRAAVLALAAGCGAAPREAPPPAPEAAPAPAVRAPRYVVLDPSWIERDEDGLDRVVAGGRRLSLAGTTIARLGPATPEIDDGARMPSWAAGRARYVFWKGKQLYGAAAWDGDLFPIATLPAEPRAAFDWLGGTGLLLHGGALVVPAAGGPPARIGVPAAVRAVAADARRAVAVDVLGRAFLTTDGATFRDVSDELGRAANLVVRDDEIAALLPDGRERFVTASGAVEGPRPGRAPGAVRGRRPPDEPDRFPGGPSHALDAAVRAGLFDADGVIAADGGFVGRLDPETLRTTALSALDPGLAGADCVAFRAADAPVLACAAADRAAVVDLSGAPRTERTFDLAGAGDLTRFVGVDGEAIGYVGPCDGPPAPGPELSPSGEAYNASAQHSAVFCVRAGRDAWVEHRLAPADAADVLAWIPRAGGGAAALVARQGTLIDERERVSAQGGLRVVRFPRNEAPIALAPYALEGAVTLDRSRRIGADDVIDGWLPAAAGGGPAAVSIDAAGHARAWPTPPRFGTVSASGRFGLAYTDDGKLWETLDTGHTWTPVEAPPAATELQVNGCSPAGCRIGPYVRLGWSARPAAPPKEAAPAPPKTPPRHEEDRRSRPPVVRLSCTFAGPPESRRVADSGGFGYTPAPQPRNGSPARVGTVGIATIPHSGGSPAPLVGDVEVGWIAPLDTAATIHRITLPVAALDLPSGSYRPHEFRLGWLLAADGGLASIALGGERCQSRFLERAGVTRAIGGCLAEPAVGVDLGGRLFAVHPSYEILEVISGSAPVTARGRAAAAPVSLPHELWRSAPAGVALHDFAFGVGARAGAPVAVVVDVGGDAALAPIDPERGTLGAEERLRPLAEARLGSDPACAARPDDARVVLPFEGLIGLDRRALRPLAPGFSAGVAVIRWSRDRACLDAAEISVRDERLEEGPAGYEPPGSVHKVIARFEPSGAKATLFLAALGMEVRQRLACAGTVAGAGE